jgi:serine/threonine-protein kinase
MSAADDKIQDLASRILDGAPIDWGGDAAGLDEDSLDDLRALAAIVSFHRELPEPAGARSDTARLTQPASPSAGPDHWGPLRLIERIGQGAFGEVYRAWDTRLDREVALKLLHPGSRDPDRGAVVGEGRLLARVRHPNVVTVFGAERIEGRVGIWTEFVHGSTLASRVQQHGPLTVGGTIAVGVELCKALAAIHDAGLVHGDVKAQNVLQETGGRTVLVDLGTGREYAREVSALPVGEVSGTPLYMAPELWQRAAPTPQSDLYSLGVLMYHLLTADFPVGGMTAADVRESHAAGRRVPLRNRRADVPATVAAVVERMLEPDPARRFQSADQVRAALVRAAPGTIRRRRIRLAVALAGAAGLVTLSILLWSGQIGWRGAGGLRLLIPTPLTFQPPEDPVLAAAISPDAEHLAYATLTGLSLQTISTRDVRRVPGPPAGLTITHMEWIPGSSDLIVAAGPEGGLWRVSTTSGTWSRVFDRSGPIAVSPDGRRVALAGGDRGFLIVIELDSGKWHEIVEPQPGVRVSRATWAPDGTRLAYSARVVEAGKPRVEIVVRRPDGSDDVHIPWSNSLRFMAWVEGRILISGHSSADSRDDDLWSIDVDAATGRAIGEPTKFARLPGHNINVPVLTGDRSQMVFWSQRLFGQVVVADFDPDRRVLTNISQKVSMSGIDRPLAWLPGDRILFESSLDRQLLYFLQPVDRQEPRSLWPGRPKTTDWPAVSADGRWILYARMPPGEQRLQLMRLASSGGDPERILDLSSTSVAIRCGTTAGSSCVVAEQRNQPVRLELTAVNPGTGEARSLPSLSAPHRSAWTLTPDGSSVAWLDATSSTGRVQTLNLATGERQSVDAAEVKGANFIAWPHSGSGWIVAKQVTQRGDQVLYVGPDGRATMLWESPHRSLASPQMSPDGRRIAFKMGWVESNVWLLRGY